MNVLHVMPSLSRTYGGPVTALLGYVRAGAASGARATVLGPRCSAADAAWLGSELPDTRLVMAGGAGAGPWSGAPGVLTMLGHLARTADVVHVHGLLNPTSSGAARLAITARRPLVIGPFGTLSRYTFSYRRSGAKRLYLALVDRPNLCRASALHFTTAAERDDAVWHDADDAVRTYIVPPPYDVRAPRECPGDPPPLDGARPPVVVFLGRLDPKKGVDLLLEAWGNVAAKLPGGELRIAGAGSPRYTAYLRARSTAAQAGDTTRFVGFVHGAEKRRLLAEASVVVLPSHHENFGISVLDAIAAGVPVVVTPGVQLAPWVAAHEVGRVVGRTADAVGQGIVGVLSDCSLRSRVALTGRETVARAFAPGVVAPALAAMYAGALARHRGVA